MLTVHNVVSNGRARRILRAAAAAVAIGWLVAAVVGQWQSLRADLGRLPVLNLTGSATAGAAAVGLSMLSWRAVLADLGSPLPPRAAGNVYFVSQTAKYVPGSVWQALAQVELGRRYGVSRGRSAAALFLAVVLSLVAAGFLAAVLLPLAADIGPVAWLAVPAGLLVLAVHPRVLNKALGVAFRLARRASQPHRLTSRAIAVALIWSTAAWIAQGVMVYLLARGLGASEFRVLPLSVGAYAAAWSIGFLVLIAPAGAGVREGVLVLLLGGVLGQSSALAVALIARLLMTLADGIWAGAVVIRRRPARRALEEPKSPRPCRRRG